MKAHPALLIVAAFAGTLVLGVTLGANIYSKPDPGAPERSSPAQNDPSPIASNTSQSVEAPPVQQAQNETGQSNLSSLLTSGPEEKEPAVETEETAVDPQDYPSPRREQAPDTEILARVMSEPERADEISAGITQAFSRLMRAPTPEEQDRCYQTVEQLEDEFKRLKRLVRPLPQLGDLIEFEEKGEFLKLRVVAVDPKSGELKVVDPTQVMSFNWHKLAEEQSAEISRQ